MVTLMLMETDTIRDTVIPAHSRHHSSSSHHLQTRDSDQSHGPPLVTSVHTSDISSTGGWIHHRLVAGRGLCTVSCWIMSVNFSFHSKHLHQHSLYWPGAPWIIRYCQAAAAGQSSDQQGISRNFSDPTMSSKLSCLSHLSYDALHTTTIHYLDLCQRNFAKSSQYLVPASIRKRSLKLSAICQWLALQTNIQISGGYTVINQQGEGPSRNFVVCVISTL